MLNEIGGLILAAHFTAYTAFGDRGIALPPPANSHPKVEATVDRGSIVELMLRCGASKGSAVIPYSKIDRRYCTPRFACTRNLADAISRTCRQ